MNHLPRQLAGRLKGAFWELVAASLVINLFTLATPLFMMTVYNKVVGQGALATLDVLALELLGIYLFDALLRGIRSQVAAHAGAWLEVWLGESAMTHLLALPYRHFETLLARWLILLIMALVARLAAETPPPLGLYRFAICKDDYYDVIKHQI